MAMYIPELLYAITGKSTGAVLFPGTVKNPFPIN